IVIPDSLPQLKVTSSSSEALDPGVLIRRHRLAGQLTANPVCFFSHDHPQTGTRGSQRCSATAQATANNDDISREFVARPFYSANNCPGLRLPQTVGNGPGRG